MIPGAKEVQREDGDQQRQGGVEIQNGQGLAMAPDLFQLWSNVEHRLKWLTLHPPRKNVTIGNNIVKDMDMI